MTTIHYLYFYMLFIMIFMHIVDDYYLQGILASLKQKSWWRAQSSYEHKYRNDYVIALGMHAFSWSFLIMTPVYLIRMMLPPYAFFVIAGMVIFNAIIHAIVDDLKANKKKINLIQDQLIHITQIIITWGAIGLVLFI